MRLALLAGTAAISLSLLSGCAISDTPPEPTVELPAVVDPTPSVVVSLVSTTPDHNIAPMEMGPGFGLVGTVLAVSRDSGLLSIQHHPEGGESNVVSLIDIGSGDRLVDLTVPVNPVMGLNAIDFSPDGTLLAAGGLEQTVFVWDTSDERLVAELPFGDAIVDVKFSGDGRALVAASAGEHAHVTIWSVDGWVADQELNSATTSLASPAGDSTVVMGNLVSGLGGHAVTMIDVESRETQGIFDLPAMNNRIYAGMVSDVALSADGKSVAAIIDDGIRTWDLVANKEVRFSEAATPNKPVQVEYLSPSWWLILDDKGVLTIVDALTGQLINSQLLTDVRAFVVLPDGTGIISGSPTEPVQLWQLMR